MTITFNAPLSLIKETYETVRASRPLAENILTKIQEIEELRKYAKAWEEEKERNLQEDKKLAEAIISKAWENVTEAKRGLLALLQEDQKDFGATAGAPVVEHSGKIYLPCSSFDPEAAEGKMYIKVRQIVRVVRYFGMSRRGRKNVGLECDRIIYLDQYKDKTLTYAMVLGDTDRYALDREGVRKLVRRHWDAERQQYQGSIERVEADLEDKRANLRRLLLLLTAAELNLKDSSVEAEVTALLGEG
jgi:serine/threonine protein phosphatase PrpC